MPTPKPKSQEILEQIGIFGRKNASEIKIHRWKLIANSIAKTNPVESKRLLAIIAVYENDFNLAYSYFESALRYSNFKNSLVYGDYAQALIMQGRGLDAFNLLVEAFKIDPNASVLDRILSLSTSMLYAEFLPEIISIVEKFNIHKDSYMPDIERRLNIINKNSEFLESLGVSLQTYTTLIDLNNKVLYKNFYTQAKVSYHKLEGMMNIVILPENLTAEEISELNDDFVNALVELDIPYEELIKISIYFSFNNQEIKEVA